MNMAAAEDGTWDVAAYRGPLPVSDATDFTGGDPIPAQGSLAPGYEINNIHSYLCEEGPRYPRAQTNPRWKPTLRGTDGCFAPPEGRADIPRLRRPLP